MPKRQPARSNGHTTETIEALRQLHESLLARAQRAEAEGDTELVEELLLRRERVIRLLGLRWRAKRVQEDAARRDAGERYRHNI